MREAAALLHHFNALSLGEGNLIAGGNTLAAMAMTLANIAPPGSCLVDGEDGTRVPVGMNVLVERALSCALVNDRVLKRSAEAAGQPLRAHPPAGGAAQEGRKAHHRGQHVPRKEEEPAPPTCSTGWSKDDLFQRDPFRGRTAGPAAPPANAGVSEITEAPVIFAGIGSVDGLAPPSVSPIAGACWSMSTCPGRRTRRVAGAGVRRGGERLSEAQAVGGQHPGRGDRHRPLRHARRPACGAPRPGWLERLLWLVDHAAGPEMEITGDAKWRTQLARPASASMRRWRRWSQGASTSTSRCRCGLITRSPQAGRVERFPRTPRTPLPGHRGHAASAVGQLGFRLVADPQSRSRRGTPAVCPWAG